jgi:iron complex outermembrane receptor protein
MNAGVRHGARRSDHRNTLATGDTRRSPAYPSDDGRTTMMYRKSALSAAIVACLGFAAQVHAQDATAPQNADATDLDKVVVVGIRASLEKSLDTKRNNDAISEAITAEDIGKFPNTNVAEAMAQIPGVTLDRRFGQGERVSIDGTDPSLNLSFLDGHPVAQSVWLYGEQPNRGFDYTQLAPEVLGRLEIFKSPEARLVEGSLGGTILMHTRQPLDLEKTTIAGSVGYSYSQQAEHGQPNVSGFFGWKNDANTFGVAVSAQRYQEQIDRQGEEIFGYADLVKRDANGNKIVLPNGKFDYTFPNANNEDFDPDSKIPNFVNAAWFQQTRKRDSITANVQFKPTDDLEFVLSGLYIKENFNNYNQSLYNFLTLTPNEVDSFVQGKDGIISGGHSGAGSNVFYDNNARVSTPTTKGADLRFNYNAEGWGMSGQVGQSKSDNELKQYFIEPSYLGGFSWNIDHGLTFDDPAAARDPANWAGRGFMGNYGQFDTDSKDTYGQVDFRVDLDSVFNSLQFGVRRGKHEENYNLNVYTGLPATDLGTVGTIGLTDLRGFDDGSAHHIQVGRFNTVDYVSGYLSQLLQSPDAASRFNNSYAVEQTNDAAYVQANFSGGIVRGNVGVRFVRSQTEAGGYDLGGTAPSIANPPPFVVSKNKENFVLPSANIVFDTGTDLIFRVAAAKVIAFAPYNQMANNTFLNDTVLTGSGGNAELSPYESTNFNVSAEWYFAPQSVLAASVFYKNIDNYIDTSAQIERQFNSISIPGPDGNVSQTFLNFVASGQCSTDGFCDYGISRPRNAGKGKVKGFNLSYQQPFGDSGFGLTANYTYADGEDASGNDLPYQSRDSVAVSPYYEKGPFSARLSYNWRSHYLAGGYVAGAAPVSVDDYGELGASLAWHLNENLSLNLEGQNLLDSEYFQYYGEESAIANKYHSGRRFMASVRFNF